MVRFSNVSCLDFFVVCEEVVSVDVFYGFYFYFLGSLGIKGACIFDRVASGSCE